MELKGFEPFTRCLQSIVASQKEHAAPYVVEIGFEPMTSILSGCYSTAELQDYIVDTEGFEPTTSML